MFRNDLFLFIAYKLEGKGWYDEPTVYGITKRNYPEFYNRIDSLVRNNLPKSLIDKAIIDAYGFIYKKTKADKMSFPLNFLYFDFCFNSGSKIATKLLQQTINKITFANLLVDGIIGRKTLQAIKSFKGDKMKVLCMKYTMRRIQFVSHLEAHVGLINRISKLSNFIWSIMFKT